MESSKFPLKELFSLVMCTESKSAIGLIGHAPTNRTTDCNIVCGSVCDAMPKLHQAFKSNCLIILLDRTAQTHKQY